MLRNTSKLAEDIVSKNSIISKVFIKKVFEFLLRHRILDFKAKFLLILLLIYGSAKKRDRKKDLV